jgi:hypothetical protein
MSASFKYGLCICLGVFVLIAGTLLAIICGQAVVLSLFPYYDCMKHTASNFGAAILIFTTLIQWPVYGFILATGWVRRRFARYAFILASIHAVTVTVAFWFISTHPLIEEWNGIGSMG